jgi:hypothetical protein
MTGRCLTGYLARWIMLALAAALVAGALAAAVVATRHLATTPEVQVYLSDALQVGPTHKRQDLLGHFEPPETQWEIAYLLVRTGGPQVEIQDVQRDDYIILHFNDHLIGLQHLDVMGLPYSRQALQHWPVDAIGLVPGDRVIFVDTAMIDATDQGQWSLFRELLAGLAGHGHVILLSNGVGRDYELRHRLAAQAAAAYPHMSLHRWGTTPVIPADLRSQLAAHRVNAELVTTNWQAAISAARGGLRAHYIAMQPNPDTAALEVEGVTVYRSLQELMETYSPASDVSNVSSD